MAEACLVLLEPHFKFYFALPRGAAPQILRRLSLPFLQVRLLSLLSLRDEHSAVAPDGSVGQSIPSKTACRRQRMPAHTALPCQAAEQRAPSSTGRQQAVA